ncbi:MMPL family protein [Planctomycetes bacterium Pla163]|uniref:MMPL family protein n=1 Tax=Rohdeia mirabilis TaxID=2528008 RepID=A0A518CVK5_9BACT|nr:MMPL family protein [Planctomycetes bacterium Pla163]
MHRDRPTPSRWADILRVALALLVAGVGAYLHSQLPLDLANGSMKSTGTIDAAVQDRREEEFGREQVVLAMLEARGAAVTCRTDDPEIAAWLDGMHEHPDVAECRLLPESDTSALYVAIVLAGDHAALEQVVDGLRRDAPATHVLSITGQPVGEVAIAHALAAEQRRVVPAIVLVLVLVLLALFRRPSLALAALLPGAGAVGTVGLLERSMGLEIDPVSSLLAPLLLTVGVAAAVHLVQRHLDLLFAGHAPKDAPTEAARRLRRPLFLTAATTAAGFLALTPNSIPAVRTLGWTAAFGVLVAFAWTVAIVPSWLRLTVVVDRHASRATRPPRATAKWLARLLDRRARPIVAFSVIALVALATLATKVHVATNPERVLPPEHRFRTETAHIGEHLGAIETFEVLVPAEPGAAAPNMFAVLGLASDLAGHELVAGLAEPPRRAESGSVLVNVLLRPSESDQREELFAFTETRAHERGLASARVTGPAVRVSRDSQELVRDQRRSLVLMLGVILVALLAAFRDWRLALLGLIPNAVPIAALYGGLVLSGRPLSTSTAMIGTVFLGLVVDDTIHFLHAYHRARRVGARPRSAVTEAFTRTSRAIVVTTVVLATGFATAGLGELATTVEFSIIASGTVMLALVADLVLLPATLLFRSRRGRKRAPLPVPSTIEPCPTPTT